MSRRSSTRPSAPAKGTAPVETPEPEVIQSLETKEPAAPVSLEQETPSSAPEPPAQAASPEKIQTDVREKLAKKSTEDNVFVPTNPAALEKAASQVAEEKGFELNRGTSIGARLLARAQKRI